MAMLENDLRMADFYSVPEYFATDIGLVEDAGGGNMRIVRCIKRGGMLLPVYSLITPTASMIRHATAVRDAAVQLCKLGQPDHVH